MKDGTKSVADALAHWGKALKSGSVQSLIDMSRTSKRAVFLGVDVVLMVAAFAATLKVQDVGDLVFTGEGTGWLIICVMILFTAGTSTLLKVPYIRLNALDARGIAWVGVMCISVALASAVLHKIAESNLGTGVFVVFGLIFFVLSVATRLVMLETLTSLYRSQSERCRVLIYGAGTTGMQLARALSNHDSIAPVAFVDDNVTLQGMTISGLPVMRPVDIDKIVQDRDVKRVLLAMPSLSRPKLAQLARRLEMRGLEVQTLPSFSQLIGEEALLAQVNSVPTAELVGRATYGGSQEVGCSQIAGRSVMVSGGGGSIGSELCRQVINCKPTRLVIFELSEWALYEVERTLAPLAEAAGVEIVPVLGSVTEARLVRHVLRSHAVQVVLHAAAYKHVPMVERNPLVGLANNVLGTSVMAKEASAAGCERFILISSDKAVRPTNMMGASKRLAELVVQDLAARTKGTIFAMVRFGNVVGSSGSVVPLFQEQIERGGPVTVTHRDVTRYFMTPEEAVSLVLVASSFAKGGEVFVLDMGKPVRIWDLARQLIHAARYTVRDADNPDGDIEIVEKGMRPGEKLHEELTIGEGDRTTAHEKIFAVHEAHLSEIEVASALRSLLQALATGDEAAAVAVAERWVEGYGDRLAGAPDAARSDPAPA